MKVPIGFIPPSIYNLQLSSCFPQRQPLFLYQCFCHIFIGGSQVLTVSLMNVVSFLLLAVKCEAVLL